MHCCPHEARWGRPSWGDSFLWNLTAATLWHIMIKTHKETHSVSNWNPGRHLIPSLSLMPPVLCYLSAHRYIPLGVFGRAAGSQQGGLYLSRQFKACLVAADPNPPPRGDTRPLLRTPPLQIIGSFGKVSRHWNQSSPDSCQPDTHPLPWHTHAQYEDDSVHLHYSLCMIVFTC